MPAASVKEGWLTLILLWAPASLKLASPSWTKDWSIYHFPTFPVTSKDAKGTRRTGILFLPNRIWVIRSKKLLRDFSYSLKYTESIRDILPQSFLFPSHIPKTSILLSLPFLAAQTAIFTPSGYKYGLFLRVLSYRPILLSMYIIFNLYFPRPWQITL